MLVADAASFRLVIAELAQLYQDPQVTLPAIGYTFREYVEARRQENPADRDRDYWARRIATLPAPPALPLNPDRSQPAAVRTVRREFRIDGAGWLRLAGQAREHGVTLSITFLTAFCGAGLLERVTAVSAQPSAVRSTSVAP